jgi:hypothetical protein
VRRPVPTSFFHNERGSLPIRTVASLSQEAGSGCLPPTLFPPKRAGNLRSVRSPTGGSPPFYARASPVWGPGSRQLRDVAPLRDSLRPISAALSRPWRSGSLRLTPVSTPPTGDSRPTSRGSQHSLDAGLTPLGGSRSTSSATSRTRRSGSLPLHPLPALPNWDSRHLSRSASLTSGAGRRIRSPPTRRRSVAFPLILPMGWVDAHRTFVPSRCKLGRRIHG